MKYSFDISLSEKDYYEFNFYHLFNSEHGKKGILRSRLLVPVIFVLSLVYFAVKGAQAEALVFSGVFFLVISIIWFFSVKPLEKFLLKLRISSMLKKEKRPYTPDYKIEFYDDYIVEITENSKSEFKYDVLYKIAVNEGKAIYIYRNALVAQLIPFGAFATDTDRIEFLDFINAKINKERDI